MPRKIFVAGEILTASDVNTNLMDQSVMVFDDATARATAIPTPVEGMVTYLKDTDSVEKFDGDDFVGVATPPAILQVVSTTKTDSFSTASTSLADVTGLSVTITPSATSSKVLVLINISQGANTLDVFTNFQLVRESTDIAIGDASSSRARRTIHSTLGSNANSTVANGQQVASMNFVDTPATTSATTYKMQMRVSSSTGFVNRSSSDPDNTGVAGSRTVSTITVMEVAG